MADSFCIHGCLPGQPCRENPCPALREAARTMLHPEELADGMALWQELKPQTADDWLAVANRTLADGDDGSNGSLLFAALCSAVDDRNTHEMRATMAEEVAADLEAERGKLIGLLRKAEFFVGRCNHMEAHDDSRRLLIQIAALKASDDA